MPDFRTIVAKPVAPATPNGAGAAPQTPMQKAMAVLEKAAPAPAPAPTPAAPTAPAPGAAAAPGDASAATPGAPAAGAPPEADQRFTRALAAERKLQAQREAIAQERAKLEEDRKALEQRSLRPQQYQARPLEVLRDAFPGLEPRRAYELLTEAILADGKAPPELEVNAVRQELGEVKSAFEKDREERAAADKARQEKEFKAAVADVQSEIAEHLQASKASYPYMLAALEDEADAAGNKVAPELYVYSVMDRVYQDDLKHPEVVAGRREAKVLTFAEAAEKCEKFYRGKYEKLAALSGVAPAARAAAPSVSGAPQPAPGVTARRLTPQERLAKAIASLPD